MRLGPNVFAQFGLIIGNVGGRKKSFFARNSPSEGSRQLVTDVTQISISMHHTAISAIVAIRSNFVRLREACASD